MRAMITVLPGDGIGSEVTAQAVRVLRAVGDRFGHTFEFSEAMIGGAAVDQAGSPLPEDTLAACRASDAILLGAVGGPRWDDIEPSIRPERGLLQLREALGLYANVRPVSTHRALIDYSPLKRELVEEIDLVVVRELTGGIYFGEKTEGLDVAHDVCSYTAGEVERIARFACQLASKRSGRVTSVDKANVLATSRLWRATVERVVREEFPEIELEHVLVDAASMHLIQNPRRFDVILTENMFGDILSDESSVLSGSIGMLPSASIGAGGVGVFEPIHGSAPDIAGQGVANPYATILSAAMLLELGLGLAAEGQVVRASVDQAITRGVLPADMTRAANSAGSTAVGEAVLELIDRKDTFAGLSASHLAS